MTRKSLRTEKFILRELELQAKCKEEVSEAEAVSEAEEVLEEVSEAATEEVSEAEGTSEVEAAPEVVSMDKKEKIPLDQMERSKDTLYINNVPFKATKEEVAEFFGTDADSISLPMRKMRDQHTGRIFTSDSANRGMAFVTFSGENVDIEAKAEEFKGKVFGDRELTVDVAVIRPENDEEEIEQETGSEEKQE